MTTPENKLPATSRQHPSVRRLRAVGDGAAPGAGRATTAAGARRGVAAAVMPALFMARGVLARPLPTAVLDDLRTELAFAFQASRAHPAASMTRAARVAGLFVDDLGRALERARDLADDEHATAEGLVAATVLGNLAWARGRLDEGLRWGRDAVARVGDETPPMWAPYPALALAAKLVDAGELRPALALLDDADELIRRLDVDAAIGDAQLVRARLLLAEGRPAAARDLASDALATARGGGHAVPDALCVLATAALRLGDQPAARDHVWQCRLELADDRALFPSARHRSAEFLVASAYLSPERAARLLTTSYADLLSEPLVMVEDPSAAPWLVRVALAAGDALLAATVVAAAQRLAVDNPGHVAVAAAAAHADGLAQDDADALAYAGLSHRDAWAAALARDDARSRASLARHRRSLTVVRDDAAPPSTTVPLTSTEERIVELVASGMTNQQVGRALRRSPHTVNYHLRRVFRKLGVSSRVELARYVYGSGLAGD